jgi:hypothetical protein
MAEAIFAVARILVAGVVEVHVVVIKGHESTSKYPGVEAGKHDKIRYIALQSADIRLTVGANRSLHQIPTSKTSKTLPPRLWWEG